MEMIEEFMSAARGDLKCVDEATLKIVARSWWAICSKGSAERPRPRALGAVTVSKLGRLVDKHALQNPAQGEPNAARAIANAQEVLIKRGLIDAAPAERRRRTQIRFQTLLDADKYDEQRRALECAFDASIIEDPTKRAAFFLLWLGYSAYVWEASALRLLATKPLEMLWVRGAGEITVGKRRILLDPLANYLWERICSHGVPIGKMVLGENAGGRGGYIARLWKDAVRLVDLPVERKWRRFLRLTQARGIAKLDRMVTEHCRGLSHSTAWQLLDMPPLGMSGGSQHHNENANTPSGVESAIELPEMFCADPELELDFSAIAALTPLVQRAALRGDHHELEQIAGSPAAREFPVMHRAVVWAADQLASANSVSDKELLRTALGDLCPVMVEHAGNREMESFAPDERADVYEEILQTLGPDPKHSDLSRLLKRFHDQCYATAPVDWNSVGGFSLTKSDRTDSRLIPERWICSTTRVFADRYHVKKDVDDLAMAVLTIFGGRLGLRRSEGWRRTCKNIETFGPWFLHVDGELKTSSARRSLPMRDLMPPEELALVKELVQVRIAQGAGREDSLMPFGQNEVEDVFLEITRVLRIMSGDDGARFHNLRHSFANRMFAEFWRDHPILKGSALEPFLSLHPIPANSRLWGVLRRERTYGWAYQLARLLGHANPAVTARYYLHVLDAVVQAYARHDSPIIQAEQAGLIYGYDAVQSVYRRLGKGAASGNGIRVWDLA